MDTVTLGTATPGGGFPIYGQALADTIAETDPTLTVRTQNTKGSTENVPLLEAGRLDLALVQGEVAHEAVTLLVGGSQIEGLDISHLPALVTDPALGERVAALVAHVRHGVRSDEQATTIRSTLEQLLLCSIPIAAGRIRQFSRLTRVRTFLQTHVSEPVSIEDLARMSALSECHLISAFRYEFGLPPHAYHLRLRLASACEALARGMAVASVAYEYGFADQSHLSRKFKSVYGVSPAAWATRRAGTLGSAGT